MTTGVVTGTSPRSGGGTLSANVLTTDTVLLLDDAADFDEEFAETRWLVIGDESTPREYVAVANDETAQESVTLAVAAGAAYEAGLPVTPWDPDAAAADKRAVEHKVWVRLDGDLGNPRVTVPHGLIPYAVTGAHVGLVEKPEGSNEWWVDEVFGREAMVDPANVATPYIQGWISTAGGPVTVSIPNAAYTPVGGWHVASQTPGWTVDDAMIYPPRLGLYLVSFGAKWASNSSGERQAFCDRALPTSATPGWDDARKAAALQGFSNLVVETVSIEQDRAFRFGVYQDSGAALDLLAGFGMTVFSIVWVGEA